MSQCFHFSKVSLDYPELSLVLLKFYWFLIVSEGDIRLSSSSDNVYDVMVYDH